jgi:hypothetical protein
MKIGPMVACNMSPTQTKDPSQFDITVFKFRLQTYPTKNQRVYSIVRRNTLARPWGGLIVVYEPIEVALE